MVEYQVKSQIGYDNKIGELIFMMEHVRAVTLEEVKEMVTEHLDYRLSELDNSIGALLMHIASIEKVHQLISFEERDFNKEELSKWGSAIELGLKGNEINNHSINYYIDELTQVRNETLSLLKSKDDNWLYESNEWPNGVPYNNYYLWFHVLEDEINHRGQIRAIKRRLMDRR